LFISDNKLSKNVLLSTIEFPKNLVNLTERLPEPKYVNNKMNRQDTNKNLEWDDYSLPQLKVHKKLESDSKGSQGSLVKHYTNREHSYSNILPNLSENTIMTHKRPEKGNYYLLLTAL
jgi:hypothetical protein